VPGFKEPGYRGLVTGSDDAVGAGLEKGPVDQPVMTSCLSRNAQIGLFSGVFMTSVF
jgi:hypothetical protein